MITVGQSEFKQRAVDGKWERIVQILDFDNRYSYVDEFGRRVSSLPTKWVTIGVYDYLGELELEDGSIY